MFRIIACISVALTISSFAAAQSTGAASSMTRLESGFDRIPDSVQTSIYWYWISGNISKTGVVKDLEAMKKVGINRAFIGNIGLDDIPSGKVKFMSEEWWDILHTTLKTATRLNIEIGMFNAPGWSQSGGPWITPDKAMRYLTSSKTGVKGPQKLNRQLATPAGAFQDVRVIAYPLPADALRSMSSLKPAFSSSPAVSDLGNLFDQDSSTFIKLPAGQPFNIDVKMTRPFSVRSMTVNITHQRMTLDGDVQVPAGDSFRTIHHFHIDRSNPELNVGFTPYGPAAISLPPTSGTQLRIRFTNTQGDAGIRDIILSDAPVVDQYMEKTMAKMWPTPHPFWEAYKWPASTDGSTTGAVDPKTVKDISSFMKADGTIRWNVPAGNWVIERTGMTPTLVTNAPAPPEGRGLEVDKMSKTHIAAHFNAYIGKILERIPAEDRRTWKLIVEDSYETGGQNWTDSLISEFKAAYQYDPVPWMPVLHGTVVGDAGRSDRFLWDLRRLIANDVSYKYVGGLREISHQHGLNTWLENYGHWGFPGEFLQYGGQSDEIGGEFWSEGDLGDIENRAASSSAHIYGKTKVSAESFTAAGSPFARYPAMFKKRGDRFFTEGINNTLLHVYIQQPDDSGPGMTAWFGVEFNRLNTWFYDMDVLIRYLKRCNLLLQQGRYVADVAYFIGEDAPVMTGVTDPALPKGYSFDYINAEVLLTRVTVRDGKLLLPNGITYSVLVLPQLKTMRPELLKKIAELVKQGATILGPRPMSSPSMQNYPAADRQVQQLAASLWGKMNGTTVQMNSFGTGRVLQGMQLGEAFDLLKLQPDLAIRGSDSILFIHRYLDGKDIYFLSNQGVLPVKFEAAFRTTNGQPQFWDANAGTRRPVNEFNRDAGTTSIPMQLDNLESVFVVFGDNNTNNPAAGGTTTAISNGKRNYPQPVSNSTIATPWTVQFDLAMRGPVMPVIFPTLTDWKDHSNDSIKYYSGTAVYRNTFKVSTTDPSSVYRVDLGRFTAIAKVSVNGQEMGAAWTAPYQVDISKAVKTGENMIEIRVVNTWVNRLQGDSRIPKEQRTTNVFVGPDPKSGLQSAGLLGPVSIEVLKY